MRLPWILRELRTLVSFIYDVRACALIKEVEVPDLPMVVEAILIGQWNRVIGSLWQALASLLFLCLEALYIL